MKNPFWDTRLDQESHRLQLPDTPKDKALGVDLRELPKKPNYSKALVKKGARKKRIVDDSWDLTQPA